MFVAAFKPRLKWLWKALIRSVWKFQAGVYHYYRLLVLPPVPSAVTFRHSLSGRFVGAGSEISDAPALFGIFGMAASVRLALTLMWHQHKRTRDGREMPQPSRPPIRSKRIHIPALPTTRQTSVPHPNNRAIYLPLAYWTDLSSHLNTVFRKISSHLSICKKNKEISY